MPQDGGATERKRIVEELAVKVDLPALAEELGMRVVARGSRNPKALCPFHDDQTPSLVFYPGNGSARGQYHCFACGAHGDVYGLLMRLLERDFRGALEWLAARLGQPLPVIASRTELPEMRDSRAAGLKIAFDIFRRLTRIESNRLTAFGKQRGFSSAFLRNAEVYAVGAHKLTAQLQSIGREDAELLKEAGVLRQSEEQSGAGPALPMEPEFRDFFYEERVLFTLRDDRGRLAGFAGRAVEIGQEPKYLYSPGFRRSEVLYRLDRIRATLQLGRSGPTQPMHVFVVEGLLDALRIESLNMAAVAALGSQLTVSQAELLVRLADDLDRQGGSLAIHLFFDADLPGRHGIRRTVAQLLAALSAQETGNCSLDIVAPPLIAEKQDPDSLLRECRSSEDALSLLEPEKVSVMEFLLAEALGVEHQMLHEEVPRLSSAEQLRAFRDIERLLITKQWATVLSRFDLFACVSTPTPSTSTIIAAPWQQELKAYLLASRVAASTYQQTFHRPFERTATNQVQRALRIALFSGQRRELPVDEGSWERLDSAVEVAIPALQQQLEKGEFIREPLIATRLPRPDGDFRLKALPCPETLTMQQYVLNELLRDFPDAPRYIRAIPAVRYAVNMNRGRAWTTGGPTETREQETVSFAYQVDMDVIEGRNLPRKEGMFRPYSACWNEFIATIDRRAQECQTDVFYVARADIRRFYDTLPRSAVVDALLPGLRAACTEVALLSEQGSASDCIPLLLPEETAPDKRAARIIDWLCDQSFGWHFEDPKSGEKVLQPFGIPQGPDLSAYIANVALFPLDRAIQSVVAAIDSRAIAEHGNNVRGAVYTRYVDDMVLIATTPNDLARMRDEVERGLGRLGLTLSPKTEPIPAMSDGELRSWLTDRRGLARNASGPMEGPPSVEPLSTLEPLADAGEIDRSDSLSLLHDPRFTDPELPTEDVEDAVRIARRGQGLRHGDLAKAAQLLWGCVLKIPRTDQPKTAKWAADQLRTYWATTEPASDSRTKGKDRKEQSKLNFSDLLAWLDGVERRLCSRPDRNPSLPASTQKELVEQHSILADWVRNGLCHELSELFPSVDRAEHAHMIQMRCMSILRAAIMANPGNGVPEWFRDALPTMRFTPGTSRLFISIAQAGGDAGLLNRAALQLENASLWLMLHEATARLQLSDSTDKRKLPIQGEEPVESPDVLAPLDRRVREQTDFEKLLNNHNFLAEALAFLLPDHPQGGSDDHAARSAIRMLSALAPTNLEILFRKRKPLCDFVLGGRLAWPGQTIATPPGLQVPGLLGLEQKSDGTAWLAIRVDFKRRDNISLNPPLSWGDGNSIGDKALQQFRASLGSRTPMQPRRPGAPFGANQLPRLARAFRSLATRPPLGKTKVCPVTPLNILGPDLTDPAADEQDACWQPLGYDVDISALRGQAFVRRGNGLVLEWVTPQNDHIWRAGTALADALGRLENSRSVFKQRAVITANHTQSDEEWSVEAMLCYSLARLRGSAFPSDSLPRLGETFPASIERVLRRLETFPIIDNKDGGHTRLAHLFATLAEGRALFARSESDFDYKLPGAAAALLVDITRPQFRVDEDLASRLPKMDTSWPVFRPTRRPVLAWTGVSLRLARLAEVDLNEEDPTISILAAGARLLALENQLRSQALEQWALLSPAGREAIRRNPTRLGDTWSLDHTALLHRDQEVDPEIAGPGPNVRFLFDTLDSATTKGSTVRFDLLRGITPLGWLIILGTLCGTPGGEVTAGIGLKDPSRRSDLGIAFGNLAACLATAGELEGEPPWDVVNSLHAKLSTAFLEEALMVLNALDSATGVQVNLRESSIFTLIPNPRRGLVRYSSEAGSFEIPAWWVTYEGLPGERKSGIEEYFVEERALFRGTETWCGGRLIALSVVQPHLSALADIASIVGSSSVALPPQSELPFAAPELVQDSQVAGHRLSPVGPTNESKGASTVPNKIDPAADTVISASRSLAPSLEKIRRWQDASWSGRSDKARRHARVAFFQWELEDTYRHPVFEACQNRKPANLDIRNPHSWTGSESVQSCAEERRRELLKEALRACKRFNVDILLLPEYSIRPDTAAWLRDELSQRAPETSVWAGTYRVPSQSALRVNPDLDPPEAWSSVLPILLKPTKKGPVKVQLRYKKYPAVAAGEVFRPRAVPLEPEFKESTSTFDPRSFVTELICSEVFLVTNPANLPAMAHALHHLARDFGLRDLEFSRREVRDHLTKDILTFAEHSSLSDAPDQPRLILLVPAMTNRSVDYSVLGQAGFLASAITTVFCNAVAKDSHGESCIIGHDGWGREGGQIPGMPGPGPYHGTLPGIYRPPDPAAKNHVLNFGRLGKKEQALVIADIDPVYSPEGKPRPQMLLRPLSLVAHLPVIESSKYKDAKNKNEKCRCQRQADRTGDFMNIIGELATVLQQGIDNNWVTTENDSDPIKLGKTLEKLADLNSDTWLAERRKFYVQEHASNPRPWPPPVALDWLWVDLNNPGGEFPRIEIPPYSRAPGESAEQE